MKKITVCMLETPPKKNDPVFLYTNTGRAIVFASWQQWLDEGEEWLNGEKPVGWWPARKGVAPPISPVSMVY